MRLGRGGQLPVQPAAGRTGGGVHCRATLKASYDRHGVAGFLTILAEIVLRRTAPDGLTEAAWKDAERALYPAAGG